MEDKESLDAPNPAGDAPELTTEDSATSDDIALADETAQDQEQAQAEEQPKREESIAVGVQQRVSQLVQKLRERERELAAAKERERALEEAKKAKPPREEDFESHEDWLEAKVAWTVEQRIEQREKELEAKRVHDAQQTELDKIEGAWASREAATRSKYPDYDLVAKADDHMVTHDMAQAIKRSEMGPDIAYYLGKNPNESNAIASLSSYEAVLAIGRLEAKIRGQNARRKQSQAPKPPDPERSAATSSPNRLSDDSPTGDWMKARMKEVHARRAR